MTFKENWKGLTGVTFAIGIFAYYILRGGM